MALIEAKTVHCLTLHDVNKNKHSYLINGNKP